MKWTKVTAIEEIDKLVADIQKLEKVRAYSSGHVRWDQRVMSFLEEVFGRNSRYFLAFVRLTWSRAGKILLVDAYDPEGSFDPEAALERVQHKAYLNQLDTARGLLLAARDELERKELHEVYKGKDTGPEASLILKVINLAEHRLRKVIREKPDKEKDIQDAFENLLLGADIPYSREVDRIEYSSKTYTPDFSISRADLAIEFKLCTRAEREKAIIPEINDDILPYKRRFGNILFVVYDLGFIRDTDRFAKNFEDHVGVIVKVVKH